MWFFARKENLHECCRMGRRIVVMKLICSLGHCKYDCHTAHKLSQRRLTADWLAPRESDCSRMHSKVSSNWLPSYIKATRPVLEDIQNGRILSWQHSQLMQQKQCISLDSTNSSDFVMTMPCLCCEVGNYRSH